ncbi:MAG: Gfo/Idh/MocA family oxidoreductase [Candidatus Methanoperedenaceae archaeon]|nr:Gfo/Idh/MocA family oxidoreductase [Candidatus Methanoperedenaceae archaeon]
MEKLKVAVVGCGLIAKARHIPGYMTMKKKVDLCAVCDKNEQLARETAKKYHISKAYSDVSEMLSKEKLDIVDICVPPQIHAPIAIEAIENGCHVIMEKPMALKTSDCDQMIDAARKHGVKLCVIHNNIFDPPFLKAKKLVEDGAIGDFVGMRIFLSTHRSDMIDLKDHWYHKLPGGVMGETGPHMAYMSLALLKNVKNVDIYAKNFLGHPWAPFDEFRIELDGEKGISSVALSYSRNCWAANVDIIGTEAALHMDLQSMLLIRYQLKELNYLPLARSSLSTIFQIIGGTASNVYKVVMGMREIGGDVVINRFVDSVLNDTQPPVTGEEGREVVRVMEMVVKRYQEKYVDSLQISEKIK